MENVLPEDLPISTLNFVVIGRYIEMAAVALMVFDWIITFDLEVAFIWYSRWTIPKVVYLLNRYILLVVGVALVYLRGHITDVSLCGNLFRTEGVLYGIGLYVAEFLIVLRVCVVWGMNKAIVTALATFYVGTFIYNQATYIISLEKVQFFIFSPLDGCLAKIDHRTLFGSFILLVVYDGVMLAMMSWPAIQEYRLLGRVLTKSDLLMLVYGEGVLFYVYLLMVSIATIALMFKIPENIFLLFFMTRIIRSILAARVLLHTRSLSHSDQPPRSLARHTSENSAWI